MAGRGSRVKKTILNAQVNLFFYFITLALSFFSRKIFLENLSDDFVGLTSTLQNLLGFLNLAELGIGSAIGYVLYKPLFDNNHGKINEIISVFGFLYRRIGTVILLSGILLSAFLPFIFSKSEVSITLVYFAYYSFLTSSLIGYYFNYKQTLLGADQRNYVVTAYFQTANFIKAIIQITSALYTENCYLWVAVELVFAILYSIILNRKIKSVYPWLESEVKRGKKLLKLYPEVIRYTKQLFVHKIAFFAQFQTTPFILYMFSTLTIVAHYTNYTLIVNQLINFANKILGSTEAGIGNLVAENKVEKSYSIFQELTSFRYWVAGIEVYAIYHLIEPFIILWLGEEYVMDKLVLVLILINMFIMQTRGTNDQFLNAYGLFRDVWAPIAETSLSLLSAVYLGYQWGLSGVLAGMLIGMIAIVVCWKPYFLFHCGFHKPVIMYWKVMVLHLIALGTAFCASTALTGKIITMTYDNYLHWCINAMIHVLTFAVSSFMLLFLLTPGAKLLFNRLKEKI